MNNYKIQDGCHNCKHVMDDGFVDCPAYYCSCGHKPFKALKKYAGETLRRARYVEKFKCQPVELFGICDKHPLNPHERKHK